MSSSTESLAVALVCYLLVLLGSSTFLGCILHRKLDTLRSLSAMFQVCIIIFLATRALWCSVRLHDDTTDFGFVINRCCSCLYFLSFSIILFSWIQLMSTRFRLSKSQFFPRLKWSLVALNVVTWSFTLVVCIVFLCHEDDSYGSRLYDWNQFAIAGGLLTLALGFLFYGVRLVRLVWNKGPLRTAGLRILVFAVLVTVCWLVRCVMLLYRIVTDELIPNGLFMAMTYIIPELVPIMGQAFFILRRARHQSTRLQYLRASMPIGPTGAPGDDQKTQRLLTSVASDDASTKQLYAADQATTSGAGLTALRGSLADPQSSASRTIHSRSYMSSLSSDGGQYPPSAKLVPKAVTSVLAQSGGMTPQEHMEVVASALLQGGSFLVTANDALHQRPEGLDVTAALRSGQLEISRQGARSSYNPREEEEEYRSPTSRQAGGQSRRRRSSSVDAPGNSSISSSMRLSQSALVAVGTRSTTEVRDPPALRDGSLSTASRVTQDETQETSSGGSGSGESSGQELAGAVSPLPLVEPVPPTAHSQENSINLEDIDV